MRQRSTIRPSRLGQRGFTIIEIVITLLVSSILAIGIVGYIGDAVEGFAASSNRNKLATSGRNVVDRIALELHNAVPNSIRVSTAQGTGDQCLEFIPFIGASNYRDAPFTGGGGTDFEAIDFNPVLTLASPADRHAVIYPINIQDLYDGGSPGPRALIDEIEDTGGADGLVTVRLDATHRFSRRSQWSGFMWQIGRSVSVLRVGSFFDIRTTDFNRRNARRIPHPVCLKQRQTEH